MHASLYEKEVSLEFYEDRFEQGYMDDWPLEKKQRVIEIIRELPLPEKGIALDFGCGNGVFTEVLRVALPHWEIHGCDISVTAVENARKRFPGCRFFVYEDQSSTDKQFDFVFSHHVMEHVYDIRKTFSDVNQFLKPSAHMLHIFPCGNEGSFEYGICNLRSDGINKAIGNRFFFEDEGHVRRLTTKETSDLLAEYGFKLSRDYYSNQYFGAIRWLIQCGPSYVLNFADPGKSKDQRAFWRLMYVRVKLLLFSFLYLPVKVHNYIRQLKKRKVKHYLIWAVDIIPYCLVSPFQWAIDYLTKREWQQRKHQADGSEMYLFYSRQ